MQQENGETNLVKNISAKPFSLPKSQLDALSTLSTIVADTGELQEIRRFKPVDSTTNPSLLLKACKLPEYSNIVDEVLLKNFSDKFFSFSNDSDGKASFEAFLKANISDVVDILSVRFGIEILKYVPGVVSTEIDARLSFDTAKTIEKTRKIIAMYEQNNIDRSRILIKLASTWEGLKAAEILESEQIHCNMTLIFSLCQAIEAAHIKATLISPFVGRITDWQKNFLKVDGFEANKDPGVISVRNIYSYYKKHDIKTIVMGASFRNKEQILALAGCDKLTISPTLLNELSFSEYKHLDRNIISNTNNTLYENAIKYDEASQRQALNEDQCATEKLSEGIRRFAQDTEKLEQILIDRVLVLWQEKLSETL